MIRKQKAIRDQLFRHLWKRQAQNASQGWDKLEGCKVSRSTWFNWFSGKSSPSVDNLEKILDHLDLVVLIVDKKTGQTHTGKTVELK